MTSGKSLRHFTSLRQYPSSRHWPVWPRRLDDGRELLLRIGVWLHHARGHDQRHGLVDRQIPFDHLAARGIEEKAGGRVWRAWQEARDIIVAARQLRSKIARRR